MKIRIGTRKSKLALVQTQMVVEVIKSYYTDIDCTIVPIVTSGDLITDKPLHDIGGKALFVKELEIALYNNTIDMAVHSLKDVPGLLPQGLVLGAMLERESANDVLISQSAKSINELPRNAIVGTSSIRRSIYLKKLRPDLQIVNFRGNVDSRIAKLLNKEVDATILAHAGLNRTQAFNSEYCHLISIEEMLPAVGQGVIAIEIRDDDKNMKKICARMNHELTWHSVQGERAFLEYLQADCKTPLAAHAIPINATQLQLYFMLGNIECNKFLYAQEIVNIIDAPKAAINAAIKMSNELENRI